MAAYTKGITVDFYLALLADLPQPKAVWQDAALRFPGHPDLADRWAAVAFEGHYLRVRYALDALIERVRHEDALREPIDYQLALPAELVPDAGLVLDDESVSYAGPCELRAVR